MSWPYCANDTRRDLEEGNASSGIRDAQEDCFQPGVRGGTDHRVGREQQQRPHNSPRQDGPSPPSSKDEPEHHHHWNHETIVALGSNRRSSIPLVPRSTRASDGPASGYVPGGPPTCFLLLAFMGARYAVELALASRARSSRSMISRLPSSSSWTLSRTNPYRS